MESGVFTRQYQVVLLGILNKGFPNYVYGAITLFGIAFQKFSTSMVKPNLSPHTTFPQRSPLRIQFDLFRFRSPLVTESRLLSFPALIRMFWFSAFPFPDGNLRELPPKGRPIRASPDQRSLATTRSLSQLVTPFISLRSLDIPQTAWAY